MTEGERKETEKKRDRMHRGIKRRLELMTVLNSLTQLQRTLNRDTGAPQQYHSETNSNTHTCTSTTS